MLDSSDKKTFFGACPHDCPDTCAMIYEVENNKLLSVKGNKDHDHIDNDGNLYDAKNFTKGGLNFMPSNQIGAGRKLNKEIAIEKANKLIYICVDITQLPTLQIIFVKGNKLAEKYNNFKIPFKKREELFTSISDDDLHEEVTLV